LRQQLKHLENRTHRDDSRLTMKSQLIAIVAAVLVVGCGPSVDIWKAADEGNIEAVKQNLATGADVNDRTDFYSETPLHFAAENGQKEVAQILIDKSADVNAKAKWDRTPLHGAAKTGRSEIVKLLIETGADLNPKDFENKTPLDEAIKYKYSVVADILRKHGGKTGAELKAEGK